MQADIVLAALRVNTPASLRLAEALVGKKIVRCPPCLRGAKRRPPAARLEGDDRLVVRVREPQSTERTGKRRLLGSPLYERIARARVGMSVGSLLGRGLRRKDVRIAVKRGYVELSA
jgi:hypothetical protein